MKETMEDLRKPHPEVFTKLVIVSCDKIPCILRKGREHPGNLRWDEKMVYEAHTDPDTKLMISHDYTKI